MQATRIILILYSVGIWVTLSVVSIISKLDPNRIKYVLIIIIVCALINLWLGIRGALYNKE